ncbi:hypothetical protein M3Y97_01100900 [Aphelenchoides bicaudatus]|nr:hypothetical protein M3Y97_01100900 [Aphelenchoides bicaudatus]
MLISVLFALLVSQVVNSSELFFNIKKLTTTGQHSLPRFSSDNRYIYFTASGGDYGKECDEIYRLDLKYMDKVDEPGRISRVSTGFGHSTSAAPPYESGDQSTFFESSFEKALNIQNFNPTSNNHGCPPSLCQGSNQPYGCAFSHVEHFPNTYIYEQNNQNRLQRIQDTLTEGDYYISPARSGSKLAYTRNCMTTYEDFEDEDPITRASTCLDPDQRTDPPVLYDYFNFAAKQSDPSGTRVSYLQKVNVGDMNTIRYVFPLNSFNVPESIWNGTDLIYMDSDKYCGSVTNTETFITKQSLTDNANCKQIYNIHTYFDDFSSPRLLSTSLGSVDGFDIFVQGGEKKIVYAGDFLKAPKDQDKTSVHKCYLSGCDDPNKVTELQQFCQSTPSTKYFGPSFDLFVTNIYGNVEKRLTSSNTWNGGVAVDQSVTSNLPAGYRGGVSIAGNNKILYHAYIPQAGNELTNFQHILDTYQVVDTHNLEIYQLDLSNQNNEHQITQLNKKSQNPAYTRDGKILFETNYNQADEKTSAIYRIDSDTYRSVSIGSDTNTDFVFVKETGTTNQLHFGGYQAPPPSLPTTEQPTTIVTEKSTTVTVERHQTEGIKSTPTTSGYNIGGGDDDGSSANCQLLSKLLIGLVLLK